ncbi:hypothetical protein PR048_025861 [Dryococelus australis]|uniref:Uncharacterized protein n=1 Tax=Dryococelus australis TaxID=614101 RepID=A0ABQ9GJT1_9NEOP|nr:hypothetical protein PR048_025861 [Dryococelus australis]
MLCPESNGDQECSHDPGNATTEPGLLPEYAGRQQEDPRQFLTPCKMEFAWTLAPKTYFTGRKVVTRLREELYTQSQRPGEEAELFTCHKALLFQRVCLGAEEDEGVER